MRTKPFGLIALVAFLATFLSACAGGRYLETGEASPLEVSGTYTLLLHGGRYSEDMQNVVIFDKEGDSYTFEIYAPQYDYKTRKGLPAEEAVEQAESFVRFHYAFWKSQWRKILDYSGHVIGYEVRPLYLPLQTGYPDILEIRYVMKDTKVIARIGFKPEIERDILKEGRGPFISRPMR